MAEGVAFERGLHFRARLTEATTDGGAKVWTEAEKRGRGVVVELSRRAGRRGEIDAVQGEGDVDLRFVRVSLQPYE